MANWFAPPVFAGADETQKARRFHTVVWATMLIGNGFLAAIMVQQPAMIPRCLFAMAVVALLSLVVLTLNRRGRTRLSSQLFVGGLVVLLTVMAFSAGGIRSPGVTMYFTVALMAGLLLGERAGIATAAVCIILGFCLVLLQEFGFLPEPVQYSAATVWLLNCIYISVGIILLRLATRAITNALHRAESELSERRNVEQRLERALAAGSIGVWEADLAASHFYADDRTFALLGLPASADRMIAVDAWMSLVCPDDRPNMSSVVDDFSSGRTHSQIEYRIVRPDGVLRHMEATAYPVRNEKEELVRHVGTLVDVTERKEAEQLRERLVVDLGERVKELRLLHAAAKLLRDRPFDRSVLAELVKMFPAAWMYPECCEARIAYLDMDVTTPGWRESPWRLSQPFTTSAGEGVIEVAYVAERPPAQDGPFFTEERDLLRSLAEMLVAYLERDLAERRRRGLEGQLRQSQKMEALGTLAGGIAHDFNNLLAAIRSNAELALLDVPRRHPARVSLDQIAKASERAKDIVKQILLFSRRQEMERKTIQLSTVIEDALRFLRATLPANIEMRADIAPDLPPISGDASQIYQVIMNLGTNAAHAMRAAGGVLSVSTDQVTIDASAAAPSAELQPGKYVRFTVRDTGSGMSRETLDRLFEPFFTTKGHAGTGLGLSVVHGIVKDHLGAITVQSELGRGATFSVYLPAALPAAVAAQPEAAGPIQGHGEHVMYVDDEEDLVFVTERILKRLGYRCTAYSDANSAMQAFRTDPQQFDAVITDMAMPEMSGLELARALRQIRPDVRLAVTSGRWDEDAELARLAGIATRIQKPASIEELSRALYGLFHPVH